MTDFLRAHIARFIELPDEEWQRMRGLFRPLKVGKKANLLVPGEVCQTNYFVERGCLRLFFISDKGTDQTTQFALEGWWLADYQSLATDTPAAFGIQAVEPSVLLALSHADQEQLLQEFPRMERYFRLIHQRAHAAAQFRIKSLYELSREELYRHFSQHYPEFVQRVPQYLLASFLGFTPEYLSQIRARHVS